MIRFGILQIKDIENTDYAFRGYDPKKFKIEDYELRYEGEFEALEDKSDLEMCEVIFYMFNVRIPEDFRGHSMSMSDLVLIDRDGSQRLYYCDICGFERLRGLTYEA